MQLFVLRHGDAVPGSPDHLRELSQYGRHQVTAMAHSNSSLVTEIDLVLISPILRAQQTAQLFLDAMDYRGERQNADCLTHWSKPKEVDTLLQQYAGRNLLLISHMPLVAYLVGYFTGGHNLPFGTASLAALEMDHPGQGMASLKWIRACSY